MEISEVIVCRINEAIRKSGMTYQQIADQSGVPKSTLERIVNGKTPNPSIQTVAALASTLGVPILPAETNVEEAAAGDIKYIYEDRISRLRAHYNGLLAEKGRWITRLFWLCLGLFAVILLMVALIVGILLYDAQHPDIGWIREQLAAYTTGAAGSPLIRLFK